MDPAGKVVWGIFLAYRRPMGVAKTYQEVGFNRRTSGAEEGATAMPLIVRAS